MNRRRDRGFTLVELLVVIAIIGVLASLVMPALLRARDKANRAKCASNLKQLATACTNYSGDPTCYASQRFPHIRPPSASGGIDDGYEGKTASCCFRVLIFKKMLDACENFKCPTSPDLDEQMGSTAVTDPTTWVWGQEPTTQGTAQKVGPIANPLGTDVTLKDQQYLSYGYAMLVINIGGGAGSKTLVAADKSRLQTSSTGTNSGTHTNNMIGNHKDVMEVVYADTHTDEIAPDSPSITTGNIASTPTRFE